MALFLAACLPGTSLFAAASSTDDKQQLTIFLRQAFGPDIPKTQRLWLSEQQRKELQKQLQRPFRHRSLRYWGNANHSVWLLNEIGKERPITTAVEIKNGVVHRVRVLAYRESRGGEVQADWFLQQFAGMQTDDLAGIHRQIDTISGATLSVNALKKQVATALLAASWINNSPASDN